MAARKKSPTLADIYTSLGHLDGRLTSQNDKLDEIHTEVKRTNGRVTKLEKRAELEDGIDSWQKDNKVTPKEDGKWTAREKTLTGIIVSLIAIVSAAIGSGAIKP